MKTICLDAKCGRTLFCTKCKWMWDRTIVRLRMWLSNSMRLTFLCLFLFHSLSVCVCVFIYFFSSFTPYHCSFHYIIQWNRDVHILILCHCLHTPFLSCFFFVYFSASSTRHIYLHCVALSGPVQFFSHSSCIRIILICANRLCTLCWTWKRQQQCRNWQNDKQ